ncbi:MAG: hypothetical protein D6772_10735 [Bacteroidetes bacterium]|nr:MAG: hypothetical protein D6772_10735 [Bacteroidota bacterium]
MIRKTYTSLLTFGLLVIAGLIVGCERELDELVPAQFPANGEVFIDNFSAGLQYAAFGGSDVTAFQVVNEGTYSGTAVMRFDVPDFEDPAGAYAGGSFFVPGGRDLTGFTVLTFWARSSKAANIDVLGFGNDLGANRFVTTINNVPVTSRWKKYYIPIPDPSKLTQEAGMFFYSEGPENERGYTFWIDEVQFENLGTIAFQEAAIFNGEDQVVNAENGNTYNANGYAIFNLPNGVNQRVEAAPAYFSYTSSNPAVASVNADGQITVLSEGEAVITATLAGKEVSGSLTITSSGTPTLPTTPAPTPTQPADKVISIYSNAYTNEPLDFINGFWQGSTTLSEEIQIAGDDVIRYSQLNFVGIQFTNPVIDITAMTHVHLDIWTPDPTDPPADFKVLLFNVGPDLQFGTGDDAQHELAITAPTLQSGTWVSLDLPLSAFTGLTSRSHLAQIVLSGSISSVFVDNIYFYDDGSGMGGGDVPTVAAPSPTRPAADVISLFSEAYTNVAVDTWRTEWSMADLADITIAGNATKQYTNLSFVGVETVMNQIDLSGMTHFHIDVWSPNVAALRVKLVDFGPNGAFDGPGMGDDTEDELSFSPPTSQWVSLDIPIADFVGMTNRTNFAQLVLSGDPAGALTLFVDNVYFYSDDGSGGGDAPTVAAPIPTLPAANVISLFSDAYTNVAVDTWRTEWSMADLADITIAGNATKQYTNLSFVGVETVMNQIDLSGMTHFHVDVWTPNASALRIKLVDFGPNGAFDGPGMGDDTEHELSFAEPAQGEWISLDIPLSDFVGMTGRANFAQLIFSGDPPGELTLFVDNVYFHN